MSYSSAGIVSHFLIGRPALLAGLLFLGCLAEAGPRIHRFGHHRSLLVKDEPFIVMSIEDHGSVDFEGRPQEYYFRSVSELRANAISVTFRWSFFEEEADVYDTLILRNIKVLAERYNLKVIVLWFGTNVCGHENTVPGYVRDDTINFTPYTRSDRTWATRAGGGRGDRIYCYSLDRKHSNPVLAREEKALSVLMSWLARNDREETFIMLQIENELFVHPEMWRPWPPLFLSSGELPPGTDRYRWPNNFTAGPGDLEVECLVEMADGGRVDLALVDSLGRAVRSLTVKTNDNQRLELKGPAASDRFHLEVRRTGTANDTIKIRWIMVKPIAERCHCNRCNELFAARKDTSDQDFEQAVFMEYVRRLAAKAAKAYRGFPLFLNLLVGKESKRLLGNPYCRPNRYLDLIPQLAFLGPDIYSESDLSALEDLGIGRNVIFVPETGRPASQPFDGSLNAFSLVFDIIGTHRGVGVQHYGLNDRDVTLLTPTGRWNEDAYLIRNSFAVIQQLPTTLFTQSRNKSLFGFRELTRQSIEIDGAVIEIRPTRTPRYARGIIARYGKKLVICGIGFEAIIAKQGMDFRQVVVERCHWVGKRYEVLGGLRAASYVIKQDSARIRMEEDDFSGPASFNARERQYCVSLSVF